MYTPLCPDNFLTCSQTNGPLSLNESQYSDPCWMLISVSMRMEVRNNWHRWGEDCCRVWICNLQHDEWWYSKKRLASGSKYIPLDLNCVDVDMFASSPCGSKSILCAVGARVRVGIVAPQFSARSLCYDVLLCLKCHLRKESRKEQP